MKNGAKKPDLVVFNEETQQYDASLKPYGTSASAPGMCWHAPPAPMGSLLMQCGAYVVNRGRLLKYTLHLCRVFEMIQGNPLRNFLGYSEVLNA